MDVIGAPGPPGFLSRPHWRADLAAKQRLAKKPHCGIMKPSPSPRMALPPPAGRGGGESGSLSLCQGPGRELSGRKACSVPRPVLSASLGPPTYPVGNEGPSPQKWSRGAGERRAGPQSGISPMLLRRHIGLRAVGTLIKKTRRRLGGCTVETMAGRGNEAGKMSPLSFCVCPSPGPMNSPPQTETLCFILQMRKLRLVGGEGTCTRPRG